MALPISAAIGRGWPCAGGQVPASVPDAPTLALSAGNAQISIAWTDGNTGRSPITAHRLYAGASAGSLALVGTITTASPYLDTGLTNGTARYYALSAVNLIGEGALSAVANATPSAATALPQLSSVVMRLSADAITTQSDNTALASWPDSAGGPAWTMPTTSRQPKYRTSTVGGKPGVQFASSASSGLMLARSAATALNAATAAQTYTIFIVYRNTAAPGGAGMLLTTGNGATPLAFIGDGTEVGRNGNAGTKIPYTAQTFSTFGYTASQVDSVDRVYSNATCFGASGSGPSGGTNDYGLGSQAENGFYQNDCIIWEVVAWNRALTPVELVQCQKWACDKYGQAYPWASASAFRVFDGDSITINTGADAAQYGYPYLAAASLGLSLGQWTNVGLGGRTAAQCDAKAPNEVDGFAALTGKPTHLAYFEMYNSCLGGGLTGAQAATANGTYCSNRLAAGVAKIALGTCTDTSGNANNTTVQGKKAAFITGMTGLSSSLYTTLVRIDQDPNIGANGAAASGSAYFDPDLLHLTGKATTSGYQTLKGLFATAMAAF